jgi:hypothetical protein
MLAKLLRRSHHTNSVLESSKLFNEATFYPAFTRDLDDCKHELIIECPFILRRRIQKLYPLLRKLGQSRKQRLVTMGTWPTLKAWYPTVRV